ncbi:bifunctional indole-3-glycerol-phosphate synthase TrpC/phosphoribosylanthranilate isomerase TrpF [Buchnera aphidicola]|uniref:bifunctional indole-3-glycerol-phosphate synthase TrpC/phosphoribosylanthranilate isomerase TrpF n=1 Tax=Buchnera aphidicola TaxID=9 RepID=UPI0034646299
MQENILKKIINYKLTWLKKKKKQQPLNVIKKDITHSKRNFYQSLKITRPFFILEAKQSSPSRGIINYKFNIQKIAQNYQTHAAVMSILTDEKYFNGKFEFLTEAHNIINIPILCKDFFIDPYQIYLARYYQADAILLMLSVLNNEEYSILANIAHSLNMGILTEINNINELNRAIQLNAKVIGINNRNLKDLSIDINRTYQLAPLIPKNKIIISESGIKNNFEIKKLSKIVDGFLIGSSIMKEKKINIFINKLIFGNNKICGLTKLEDAKLSEKLGAVYGGLIFVKNSPRYVELNLAKYIVENSKLEYVGVFQNEQIKNIVSITKKIPLFAIQLHGKEDQKYIFNLKKNISQNIQIWKAINVFQKNIKLNLKYINYYIFDNPQGGSGKCFDWKILKKYNLKNIFLSGGLSLNNCLDAMQLNCFGLDFNSKIEKTPGIKDHNKLKLLFQQLRLN